MDTVQEEPEIGFGGRADQPVIVVDDVHKSFIVGDKKIGSLKTLAIWGSGRRKKEAVDVLNGASFTINRGESVALIGRNGAGKSTLLMLISKIYRPSQGSVEVHGRVAPLLELGAGFHPDLTGRDNVIYNGMLLGLSRREIEAHMPDIIEFADIGDYIDRPTRTYSSGMQSRLGFSVAIHINPDILIVDEVLAVGDVAFVRKCQAKVDEFKKRGGTILLVSHDMNLIRNATDRVVWLESGRVHEDGPPSQVLPRYLQFMGAVTAIEQTVEPRREHPVAAGEVLAENATHKPVRYLIDVPLAAGPAFRDGVCEALGSSVCEIYRGPKASHRLPEVLKTPLSDEISVVLGHFSTALSQFLGVPGTFSAMFRDPLRHAAALYAWERAIPRSAFHTVAQELNIAEFFDGHLSPIFENPATKLLAGTVSLDSLWTEHLSLPDDELLELALANLKELDFIGIAEDFESSLEDLGRLLGTPINIMKETLKFGSQYVEGLTEEERERVLAHFRLDAQLYAAAVMERAERLHPSAER